MRPGMTNLFDYLLRKYNEKERPNDINEFVKFADSHLKFNGITTSTLVGPGASLRLADGTIVAIGEVPEMTDNFKMDDGAVDIIAKS